MFAQSQASHSSACNMPPPLSSSPPLYYSRDVNGVSGDGVGGVELGDKAMEEEEECSKVIREVSLLSSDWEWDETNEIDVEFGVASGMGSHACSQWQKSGEQIYI